MDIDIMIEAIGGIDASIIDEVLAEGHKMKNVTVFAKRSLLKWAAVAAAIVVIAAGTLPAVKMLYSFNNGNLVNPGSSGDSGDSGIVSPVDGDSEHSSKPDNENNHSSEESGSGEAQGGNDAERDSKPKATDSLVDHSGSAPGGNQPADDPGEFVITGWEEPSGETGEFVKDNMPDITLRINGEPILFYYKKSIYIKNSDDVSVDGTVICNVVDKYSDHNTCAVYLNSDSSNLFKYQRYGKMSSYSGIEEPVGKDEAAAITKAAKQIILNTDIGFANLDNATSTVRKVDETYHIILTTPEESVEVCIDIYGEFESLNVLSDARNQPSEEMIVAAKEKMYRKLAELNKAASGGKYVLDKAHFEAWGENTYIVFTVNYYDIRSDARSAYNYYYLLDSVFG